MLNKKFYNFNNIRTCYSIEGEGDTIVLLHGFLESMDIWESFSKELKSNYKVVLIDLLGHGCSNTNLDNIETYTMEMMAESVDAVLTALNIENCVMIGRSMGGYVTLAYAEMYTKKLKGFGLFHSQAMADTTEAKINRGRAIQVVKDNHKDFISAFIPDLFTTKNQTLLATEISDLQKAARSMSKESVIASLDGLRHRTDKMKLLRTANIPIMFIIGKQDSRTPLEKMFIQIEAVKHAEVLILDDVCHMGYLESFNKTLFFVEHFSKTCFNIV